MLKRLITCIILTAFLLNATLTDLSWAIQSAGLRQVPLTEVREGATESRKEFDLAFAGATVPTGVNLPSTAYDPRSKTQDPGPKIAASPTMTKPPGQNRAIRSLLKQLGELNSGLREFEGTVAGTPLEPHIDLIINSLDSAVSGLNGSVKMANLSSDISQAYCGILDLGHLLPKGGKRASYADKIVKVFERFAALVRKGQPPRFKHEDIPAAVRTIIYHCCVKAEEILTRYANRDASEETSQSVRGLTEKIRALGKDVMRATAKVDYRGNWVKQAKEILERLENDETLALTPQFKNALMRNPGYLTVAHKWAVYLEDLPSASPATFNLPTPAPVNRDRIGPTLRAHSAHVSDV